MTLRAGEEEGFKTPEQVLPGKRLRGKTTPDSSDAAPATAGKGKTCAGTVGAMKGKGKVGGMKGKGGGKGKGMGKQMPEAVYKLLASKGKGKYNSKGKTTNTEKTPEKDENMPSPSPAASGTPGNLKKKKSKMRLAKSPDEKPSDSATPPPKKLKKKKSFQTARAGESLPDVPVEEISSAESKKRKSPDSPDNKSPGSNARPGTVLPSLLLELKDQPTSEYVEDPEERRLKKSKPADDNEDCLKQTRLEDLKHIVKTPRQYSKILQCATATETSPA